MATTESSVNSGHENWAEIAFGGESGVRVRVVDLTHQFSIHTPGWVGYPSPKLSYFQRHATHGIVSPDARAAAALGHALRRRDAHHLRRQRHARSRHRPALPRGRHRRHLRRDGGLVGDQAASHHRPRRGPQGRHPLYHTGYSPLYNGSPEEDEERYFLRHPGGDREFAEWIVEMELAWTGFDCASGDHPMNTSIRTSGAPRSRRSSTRSDRPGRRRALPGRRPVRDAPVPFSNGICHVENLGGDLEHALGTQRCVIGAFPIPIEGGEASPCRVVAFVEADGG